MIQIRKDKFGYDYAAGVKFSAEIYRESNAVVCSACHATGQVIRLKYPETLYYDYKNLETRVRTMWLCNRCANKLLTALNNMEDTYTGKEKPKE